MSPVALLERLAIETMPSDVVWIQRASTALLNEQLDALREREAALGGREPALRATPLFGVPYTQRSSGAEVRTVMARPRHEPRHSDESEGRK